MERSETMPPMFGSYEVRRGDTMIVHLSNHCGGLCGNDGLTDGFELAGEDGIFFPAEEVEILGNQIHIRSKQVKHPRNVRFKWTNYAEVRLFGANGIPVAPFRTDEFPPEKTD